MRQKNKTQNIAFFTAMVMLVAFCLGKIPVKAEEGTITLGNLEAHNVTVYVGDSGKLVPNAEIPTITVPVTTQTPAVTTQGSAVTTQGPAVTTQAPAVTTQIVDLDTEMMQNSGSSRISVATQEEKDDVRQNVTVTQDNVTTQTEFTGQDNPTTQESSTTQIMSTTSQFPTTQTAATTEAVRYETVVDEETKVVRYSFSFEKYDVELYDDNEVLKLGSDGTYSVVGTGTTKVYIKGYDIHETQRFLSEVTFTAMVNMSNVTLNVSKTLDFYSLYGSKKITLNSPVQLSDSMKNVKVTATSSNPQIRVRTQLEDNVLELEVSAKKSGMADVVVTIAGKPFTLKVRVSVVKISQTSKLLEKNHSFRLKLKGSIGKVKWSSTDKNVASVSANGVVKGKKTGTAVITASVGDMKFGCAVSVTSAKLIKVCKRAQYIGKHWKYSQAKRTQKGYYDCSALVWKAYKECAGVTFGNAFYPGTTATESKWCKDNNRLVKGGFTRKNVRNMKLQPGDVVFKATNLKDVPGTSYHVEMIVGYDCYGYNEKGKPFVTLLWANRSAGYYADKGSWVGRPVK